MAYWQAVMDADEREIVNYLSAWPDKFISATEIARRAAGKRRFQEEPNWAVQVLGRLVEKKLLEADTGGHYRIAPKEQEAGAPAASGEAATGENKPKRWIAPHIRKILEKSGKKFEDVLGEDEKKQG